MPGLLNDQQYAAQFQPGMGVSTKYGPKPPTPDEVATRGTPEWRAAFDKQDQWRAFQTHAGATAFDMGLRDEKDLGKHYFTRMREGTVDPRARGNWVKDNEGAEGFFDRGSFRPNDDNFYVSRTADQARQRYRGGNDLTRNQEDPIVPEEGQVDMWPGNQGMEGFVPQYNAQQYQPSQSWGGWSGAYGNNPGSTNPMPAASNPAGLTQPSIVQPASFSSQQGMNQPPQMSLGGANPYSGGMNRGMGMRRPRTGFGGGPAQGLNQGQTNGIHTQGMLIRR